MISGDDFFEEDEPVEKIIQAFQAGDKGLTGVTGRWQVWTESSRYLVDQQEGCVGWVQRLRGEGMGGLPHLPPLDDPSELRKDGEVIPLLEMYTFEVGEPMVMLLQVRDDDVATMRRTTVVRAIEPA